MTDKSLDRQGVVLRWCGAIVFWFTALSYAFLWVPGLIIAFVCISILWLWGLAVSDEYDRKDQEAWEKEYHAMSDEEKVDYHLRRARQYGANVDANIAQAIIERNRGYV